MGFRPRSLMPGLEPFSVARLRIEPSLDGGSLDEMIERVVLRRTCEGCGQIYHLRYNPPPSQGACGKCGGKLVQRADDTEEVVRKRYEEYLAKTAPILEHYRKKGVVKSVDGLGGLDEVEGRTRPDATTRGPETDLYRLATARSRFTTHDYKAEAKEDSCVRRTPSSRTG